MRAIHDFHTLFKQAAECTGRTEQEGRSAKQRGRIPKTVRKQFTLAVRKLWFFVIWCAETGGEDGSCLNWLQLAASVAAQSQSLQAAATTGEELRAHISIIRPETPATQAGAKAAPVCGTTAAGADLPAGKIKTNSDTTGPARQHRPTYAVDGRSPELLSSLTAQHERQATLHAELRTSEHTGDDEDGRLDGCKTADDGDSDMLVQPVSPTGTKEAPSTTPLLSPNQLIAKLWPAHGDSNPPQDQAEEHSKPLQTAAATEYSDPPAAAPNPWRAKRESRAKKSKAAAAAVFRAGQSWEPQ